MEADEVSGDGEERKGRHVVNVFLARGGRPGARGEGRCTHASDTGGADGHHVVKSRTRVVEEGNRKARSRLPRRFSLDAGLSSIRLAGSPTAYQSRTVRYI